MFDSWAHKSMEGEPPFEPTDPPRVPLYGIWLHSRQVWAKDSAGRILLYAEKDTAEQMALIDSLLDAVKSEVREITDAMYYWLERGIHVQG